MKSRWNFFLLLALAVSLIVCAWSAAQMSDRRERAQAAADDLIQCRKYLADLGPDAAIVAPSSEIDSAEISRRFRDAAGGAGIAEKLVGVEPAEPHRLAESTYEQTLVFLQLQPLTLRQTITFLHQLAQTDPNARAAHIELSSPQDADQANTDLWNTDITLAFLSYAPRGEQEQNR